MEFVKCRLAGRQEWEVGLGARPWVSFKTRLSELSHVCTPCDLERIKDVQKSHSCLRPEALSEAQVAVVVSLPLLCL